MQRFFEVNDIIGGLKPVNTNCSFDVENIKLVIICESPSYEEVAEGFPTVAATGSKIFRNLVKSEMINSPDEEYSFEANYPMFQANGVYLTNLVRYQADLNVKGESVSKDKNVRSLWSATKNQIMDEIDAIHEKFSNVPVLIACGYSFQPQIKAVVRKLNQLNWRWFVTSHPSRCDYSYCSNYNPDLWERQNIPKTELMTKIEETIQRS